MDTKSYTSIHHEQLNRRQNSFQEAFQIYETLELNSATNSPILCAQVSQSEIIDTDNLVSDSTLMSGSVSSKCMYSGSTSGSTGKSSKKRGSARPNHTPRPPNSFILYRRDKHAEILMNSNAERGFNNNAISRVVADMWKKESPQIKALYAAKANEEKQKHYIKYPDYKYQPRKNGKKSNRPSQKPQHFSNSIESIITTAESTHPPNNSHCTFESPYASNWPSQNGSGPLDYDSQFSFNHPPPPTFYDFRTISDYSLGPNYHF